MKESKLAEAQSFATKKVPATVPISCAFIRSKLLAVVAVPPVYEVHTPVEDFLAPVGIGSDEQ